MICIPIQRSRRAFVCPIAFETRTDPSLRSLQTLETSLTTTIYRKRRREEETSVEVVKMKMKMKMKMIVTLQP